MYMRTTSTVYHIEKSQKNDTYISYFFLEIHNHTFTYSGQGNFAYGFTDRVPYTSPIKHTYNASSSISSSDFLFYGGLGVCFCFLRVLSELKDIVQKKKQKNLSPFTISASFPIFYNCFRPFPSIQLNFHRNNSSFFFSHSYFMGLCR